MGVHYFFPDYLLKVCCSAHQERSLLGKFDHLSNVWHLLRGGKRLVTTRQACSETVFVIPAEAMEVAKAMLYV
ncbi:MAG: hypothetical protein AAFQ92_30015 [Bacteroidota bacterium]